MEPEAPEVREAHNQVQTQIAVVAEVEAVDQVEATPAQVPPVAPGKLVDRRLAPVEVMVAQVEQVARGSRQ